MPDCSQLIIAEDTTDFIIRYSQEAFAQYSSLDNVCVNRINRDWIVLYGPLLKNSPILNFGSYGYFTIPKLYSLMDVSVGEETGALRVRNQPGLGLMGQEITICMIDTGIDYLHEAFKNSAGRTRIAEIWDQTIQTGNTPENTDYGTLYTRDDINRAIEAANNGEDAYSIVPSRDENGHGTRLAGIAAGSVVNNTFTGIAPESEIVVVKLKESKQYLRDFYIINDDVPAYEETDIMQAVQYIRRYANRTSKPVVILLGLGSNSGSHNDSLPLEKLLDETADEVKKAVITCTGNEANNRLHYRGLYNRNQEFDEVELYVGSQNAGFTMELWGQSPDMYALGFESPSGEVIDKVPARLGQFSIINFILDYTTIEISYKIVETLTGDEVIIVKMITPTSGIWKIRVYNSSYNSREYNIWLPVKEFLNSDTFFVQSDPNTTLTNPSSAVLPIAVGGYNQNDESIYIDSGRGYNVGGLVKPEVSAPAVNIMCPKVGGGYEYATGTSIAAAITAGLSAMLMTWGIVRGNAPVMNTSDIRSLLIKGADRKNSMEYPNRYWGYGFVNIYSIFQRLI